MLYMYSILSVDQVNNTSQQPQNVSSTLLNMENLSNPNETATSGNNNGTAANLTEGSAKPPSSNRVVVLPEGGNLLQRVLNAFHTSGQQNTITTLLDHSFHR